MNQAWLSCLSCHHKLYYMQHYRCLKQMKCLNWPPNSHVTWLPQFTSRSGRYWDKIWQPHTVFIPTTLSDNKTRTHLWQFKSQRAKEMAEARALCVRMKTWLMPRSHRKPDMAAQHSTAHALATLGKVKFDTLVVYRLIMTCPQRLVWTKPSTHVIHSTQHTILGSEF